MSNQAVGGVYQTIIEEVINSSRVDFEESGVEEAVLEELRLVSTAVIHAPTFACPSLPLALSLSSFPSTRPLRIITIHLWSRDCFFPFQIPHEKQKQRSVSRTQEQHASHDPRGSLRGDAGIWGGEEWRVEFGESGGDTALFGALFKSREAPPGPLQAHLPPAKSGDPPNRQELDAAA